MIASHTRGIFVAGTDTGVGKTQIAAALGNRLRERGAIVRPRKPVESGCPSIAGVLQPQDAICLREAASDDTPLATVCRYPFSAYTSPERAATLAGLQLDLAELIEACRDGLHPADFLLVESAGAFYSPLTPNALNADLATGLGLPVLLVAEDRLGTLGQILLTTEAIERRGLELIGVVLNQLRPDRPADMDNATDLSTRLACPIMVIPHIEGTANLPPWRSIQPLLEPVAALFSRS